MAVGAFQSNAFDMFAFQGEYTVTIGATEASDTATFTARTYASVTYGATEAKDTGSFNGRLGRLVSYAATEVPDTAKFTVRVESGYKVTINATEMRDVASVDIAAFTRGYFTAMEANDTADGFAIDVFTWVNFGATEALDVAKFRMFASFFTEGDADFIYIQPENRVITVLPPLDMAAIMEDVNSSQVPGENRRIEIDQIGATRRGEE